jgi:fatty-acid desaturase
MLSLNLGGLTLVACYLIGGLLGVSLGYHRYLAHRSFEGSRWLTLALVLIGLPSGTPAQWAGNHRAHHAHVDTPLDPHSPHYGGFWRAHCGWYIGVSAWPLCLLYALAGPLRGLFDAFWRPRTNQEHLSRAPDITHDAILGPLSRPLLYTPLALAHLGATATLSCALVGEGWWAWWWFASALIYNIGDAVDSVGHLYGENPYAAYITSQATNLPWLAFFTFGDGWHANHHAFPGLARHGLLPGQVDVSYLTLKLFQRLGWLSRLNESPQRPVSEWIERIERRRGRSPSD